MKLWLRPGSKLDCPVVILHLLFCVKPATCRIHLFGISFDKKLMMSCLEKQIRVTICRHQNHSRNAVVSYSLLDSARLSSVRVGLIVVRSLSLVMDHLLTTTLTIIFRLFRLTKLKNGFSSLSF